MTEKLKVEGGHVKVARVEYKDDLDIALSDVEDVRYERSGWQVDDADGALILRTKDGEEHVVRVDLADAGKVLAELRSKPEKATPTSKAEKAAK